MTEQTIATLAGFPLLNSSSVRWTLREGAEPNVETYDVDPKTAEQLKKIDAKQPLQLIYTINGVRLAISNLWLMDVQPGSTPFILRARVADRRWFWKYGHIIRRFNMRRRIGFRAVQRQDQLGLLDIPERVWYAAYSLQSDEPPAVPSADAWDSVAMLHEVIDAALDEEFNYTGKRPAIRIDAEFKRTLPVENLVVDDASNAAVRRALSYVPEAGIYPDPVSNEIVVYSKVSGKEKEVRASILPEKATDSHIDLVTNERTRPAKVRVLFTYEAEVRFDYREVGLATTATIASESDQRVCDNVLPSPDPSLSVRQANDPSTYTVAQGTWITVDQAIRAYRNESIPNAVPLDHDVIQKAFMPFMDLWSALDLVGSLQPDIDWSSRIAALQAHYRTTFRLPRRWVDRYLSVRPVRVGTIDQASGQRAPAAVYSDYSILGSQRSLFLDAAGDNDLTYAINVQAFQETINDDSRPASAMVSIPDADQGIFHVAYSVDPYRMYEMVLPSLIDEGRIPNGNVKKNLLVADGHNIAFNAVIEGQDPPKLSANHRLAVILTLVPASPNDERQLHAIEIKPDQVRDLLPDGMREGLSDAKGPTWTIRIGPGVETARVRWIDSRATDIESIFGIGEAAPNIDDLIINRGDPADVPGQNGLTGGSLVAIAKAAAARIYASLADRFEGSASGTMNPNVRLAGWMDTVTWELMPNGNFNTRISLPDKGPELDMLSLLDASTRAIILRQAQPVGAA